MSWLVLGVIFTVITYLSWRGTVIAVYNSNDRVDEAEVPLYFGIIMTIFYFAPGFNIMLFLGYNIWFAYCALRKPKRYYGTYWILELSDKNVFHRIFKKVIGFLTKPI